MVSPLESDPSLLPDGTNARGLACLPEGARVEIEAKFLIDGAEQVGALIDSLQPRDTRSVSTVDVVDGYWDTPDWSLFRAGWAYRWRDASGIKSLTLKSIEASRDVLHKRLEVEQHVAEFPGHNGHPLLSGRVADQLEGLDLTDLRELFRVHNNRRHFDIRTPDESLIRVAIDEATISIRHPMEKPTSGGTAFMELELELVEGREESLLQVAKTMQKRFGLLQSRRGKFDRGLQAAGLSPPGAPLARWVYGDTSYLDELREREFSTDDPAIHLAYRCFLEQFEEMLAQEPKAWEGLDPEGVHQMRVRTRHLRAAFRAFKDVMPSDSIRSFNREFKWVAAALGKVRDLDVYRDSLEHYAAGVPAEDAAHDTDFQRHLADRWRKARKRLLACLKSRRYERLKDRFARFLASGPSQRAVNAYGRITIGVAARQLIGKRYKALLRDGSAISPASSTESLHALRIQCKRMRYLFEFFDPIYGHAFKPDIKRIRKLQDVLGEFQDAFVATQQLRNYVEAIPKRDRNRGQFIAIGHMVSGQDRQEAIRRYDLPQAWTKFDREGARDAVLARVVEPADSCPDKDRAPELKWISEAQSPRRPRIRQACVIPYRRVGDDTAFCLITSFNKRRWIFPKGCVDGNESLEETALKEAFEEAGLYGRVVGSPLGRYMDSKWGAALDVTVLLMEVERADEAWLEDVRLRRWVGGKKALRLIGRPELREMLRRGMRRLSGGKGPIP